jgi:hypothetical protein
LFLPFPPRIFFSPRRDVVKLLHAFLAMPKFGLLAALVFFSLSCATTRIERAQLSPESVASLGTFELPRIYSPNGDSISSPPVLDGKTIVVDFGPKLVNLKASYLEKREPVNALNADPQESEARRYLNLLATSSFGGSGLTGESELAYSPLNSLPGQCTCKDWPKMFRFGLKNRWAGLRYGADYKSIDRGFVSLAGIATEHTRDESQLWGEHALGPFSIRGTISESWEKPLDTDGLRVSRGPTVTLSFNRSQWRAMLASTYQWVEQRSASDQEKTVLTNTLAGSYRPFSFLSVNPNFSITEERNPYTGARTGTPRTELNFAYTPSRDSFKLIGGSSFTRSFSADGLNNVRSFGTTAALDWKLGKFLGEDDILSFNLNYNQQLDFTPSTNSQNNFSGMLQLKIFGF